MSPRILFLLFTAFTALFTFPLITAPATQAVDLGPDTRLFLWTLSWNTHALLNSPLSLFDANIFFPEHNTLAYSAHQFGSALIAGPIILLTGNPLLGMNIVLFLSCILSGLGTYYLSRTLGLSIPTAIVSGLIFAFIPPRFFRMSQLHLATVHWTPFCLAFAHRYSQGGTRRHLIGAGLMFTLQAWSGGQTGLFLALTLAALCIYLFILEEVHPKSSLLADCLVCSLVLVALNLPFLLPYFQAQEELGLTRSLQEASFWAPNLQSFAASPTHIHKWLWQTIGFGEHIEKEARAYLFPGVVPILFCIVAFFRKRGDNTKPVKIGSLLDGIILLLVLAAIIIETSGGLRFGQMTASGGGRALIAAVILFCFRIAYDHRTPIAHNYRKWFKSWAQARMGVAASFYCFLGGLSLWASLGPSAGLYVTFYKLLPGFDFIRVPSRLTLLTVLAIAVLTGFGIERISQHTKNKRRFICGIGAVVLMEFSAFPLDTQLYSRTTSPMDAWIKKHGNGEPVVVLPISNPDNVVASARQHSTYMLNSISHFSPLVNGYSGFIPPKHKHLFRLLTSFPDAESLAALNQLEVSYIILHRPKDGDESWKKLINRVDKLTGLSRVATFDSGCVYKLIHLSRLGS